MQKPTISGRNGKLSDFRVVTECPMTFSLTEFETLVLDIPSDVNVYRESEINLSISLTSPSGKTVSASGFYFEEYCFNPKNELVGPADSIPGFRFRVNLKEAGDWSFSVILSMYGKCIDSLCGNILVKDSEKTSRILRVEPTRRQTFVTELGENVVFCGRNLCWSMPIEQKNIFAEYVTSNMKMLAKNGGNMFRMWDFLECGSYIKKGVHNMNQAASAMWDKVFEATDELDVYISFVCSAHGEVSTKVDAVFGRSPWNVAQGGYIKNAEDFFTDKKTKEAYKTYLRYVVSRWGYCEHIIFELFNEIDHTDAMIAGRLDDVKNWLSEMSDYIRSIDPYHHLVTNSAGSISVTPAVYDGFDYIYYHIYNFYSMNQLSELQRNGWYAYNRPVVLGEFGFAGEHTECLLEHRFFSNDFLEIHQGNWAGIMGGGASTAMPWWWYEIPPEYDSYKCYKVISNFAKQIPWNRADLSNVFDECVNISNHRISVMGYRGTDCAYLWIFDNNYLSMCRDSIVFKNETISFELDSGEYLAECIDTHSGNVIKREKIIALDRNIEINMPIWSKDIALKIEKE